MTRRIVLIVCGVAVVIVTAAVFAYVSRQLPSMSATTGSRHTSFAPRQDSANQTFHWIPISSLHDSRFQITGGSIYFMGIPFNDADPSSFSVGLYEYNGLPIETIYAKDKYHVYIFHETVPAVSSLRSFGYLTGADQDSFEVLYNSSGLSLDGTDFAKDITHVYDGGSIIVNADPNSFQLIFDNSLPSGGYFEPTSNDDWPPTSFSKDSRHVYYHDQIFEAADPKSFAVLPPGRYVKDKDHVYSVFSADGAVAPFPVTISGADPTTFIAFNNPGIYKGNCGSGFSLQCEIDAHDKNHAYFAGNLIY